MKPSQRTGRILGTLLLAHLVTGLLTPYILLQSLAAPRGFAAGASISSFQVRLAVVLLFAGGALTVATAVTAWPLFSESTRALGMWVLALATANFALHREQLPSDATALPSS